MGAATRKSFTKMTYQRCFPDEKQDCTAFREKVYVKSALKPQYADAPMTKSERQLKYVGPASRTVKDVPKAIATGRAEMVANLHPELPRPLFGR
jgi:hypothetical protein